MADTFIWTDALVIEYAAKNEYVEEATLERFKEEKMNEKKIVYRTDDDCPVYAGDVIWYVTVDYLGIGTTKVTKNSAKNNKYKYFYDEQTAQDYVIHNKAVLRLVDVDEVLRENVKEPQERASVKIELYKLAHSIIIK